MPQRHHPWPRGLLRLQGDEAKRVIRQMHCDIQPDDNTAAGTKPREDGWREQGRGEGLGYWSGGEMEYWSDYIVNRLAIN